MYTWSRFYWLKIFQERWHLGPHSAVLKVRIPDSMLRNDPNYAWETICNARNETGVNCMQGKCLISYIISHIQYFEIWILLLSMNFGLSLKYLVMHGSYELKVILLLSLVINMKNSNLLPLLHWFSLMWYPRKPYNRCTINLVFPRKIELRFPYLICYFVIYLKE